MGVTVDLVIFKLLKHPGTLFVPLNFNSKLPQMHQYVAIKILLNFT